MAIQKTKTLTNGESGNYWKVTSINTNKQSMMATVIVSLFVAQSNSTTSPIARTNKVFSIPVTKSNLSGDVLAFCYASIKAKNDPDLVGGTDV